jgi:MoxR-like ATPase
MSADVTGTNDVAASAVLERILAASQAITGELRKAIIGQEKSIQQLLTAVFAGGHCLIHGPLASGKTLIVESLANVMSLDFRRIQFTPDLMPADISGTEILEEDRTSGRRVTKFVPGPVFCNVLMADEINRTPPKTQAALLEVMQEKQVSLGGRTNPLPAPFYVLATHVTIEQEGIYPLPEAQQDRFMFSIEMEHLGDDQTLEAIRRSTQGQPATLEKVVDGKELLEFRAAIREVRVPEHIVKYAVALVDTSRPTREDAPDFIRDYVYWGAGLRAGQYISLGAKSLAAQEGRNTATLRDVQKVFTPVLRHRMGLTFRADVDGVTVEDVIRRLLEVVPAPQE